MKDVFRTFLFDSKDGEDCFKKAANTAKLAGIFGATAAVYDVAEISKVTGFWAVTNRAFGTWLIPSVSVGVVYATGVCTAASLRHKDDPINHAIGGVTAGLTFAAYRGTWQSAVGMSLLFGLSGAFLKACRQHGMEFAPYIDRTRQKSLTVGWKQEQYPPPKQY